MNLSVFNSDREYSLSITNARSAGWLRRTKMAKQIGPLTPKISNLPIGEAKSSKNRTRPVAGTFGIPYNLGGEVSGAKRTACRTSTW